MRAPGVRSSRGLRGRSGWSLRLALCLAVAVAACATSPAHSTAVPLWSQSGGDAYNTFAAPDGAWSPIADVSQYAQLYGMGVDSRHLSGVVDAAGNLYALIACDTAVGGQCTEPESHDWFDSRLVGSGVYAVDPHGNRLWAVEEPAERWESIALVDIAGTLLVGVTTGTNNGLITFLSPKDGAVQQTAWPGHRQQVPIDVVASWHPAQSRIFGIQNVQNDEDDNTIVGMTYGPCQPSDNDDDGGCASTPYQIKVDWFSSKTYPLGGIFPTAAPAIARDATGDLLFVKPAGCTLYRVRASDGFPEFGPIAVAEHFANGSAVSCNAIVSVNPSSHAVVVSGYLGAGNAGTTRTPFVASVFSNGGPHWHHLLREPLPGDEFGNNAYVTSAIAPDGHIYSATMHVDPSDQSPDVPANITITKISADGTVVYATKTVSENSAYLRQITWLGDVLAITHGSDAEGAMGTALFDSATGQLMRILPDRFQNIGYAQSLAGTAILPGTGGQIISVNSWAAYDAACVPQDLNATQPAICSLQGECVNAQCQCVHGFGGVSCETCAAGYWGASCDECTGGHEQPCNGHGTCDGSGTHSGTGKCACDTPFSGDACDLCPFGKAGPNCELACPDGPDGHMCSNNGVCNSTIYGNGECQCYPGYAAGTCHDCAVNYNGTDCETCADGYQGADCSPCPGLNATTGQVCGGHGTCPDSGSHNGPSACVCEFPFDGDACGACQDNRVGALCDECGPTAYGPDCLQCPTVSNIVCNGHGHCNGAGTIGGTGVCECEGAFTGTFCHTCQAGHWGDDCLVCPGLHGSVPCNGNGDCTGTGSCQCSGNFAGATCDDCASYAFGKACTTCPGYTGVHPCYGNGDCDAGINGTGVCHCYAGFEGSACQSAIPHHDDDDNTGGDDDGHPSTRHKSPAPFIIGGGAAVAVVLVGALLARRWRNAHRRRAMAAGAGAPLLQSPLVGGAGAARHIPSGPVVAQPLGTTATGGGVAYAVPAPRSQSGEYAMARHTTGYGTGGGDPSKAKGEEPPI